MGGFGHCLLFKENTCHCSFALSTLLPLITFSQLAMSDSNATLPGDTPKPHKLTTIWQLAELI